MGVSGQLGNGWIIEFRGVFALAVGFIGTPCGLGIGDIKLGLGLWNYPVLSAALDMGLIGLGGMYGMMWLVVLLMGIQLLSYALPFPATPSEMALGVLLTHLAVIGVSVCLEQKGYLKNRTAICSK